jgi:hypothetical protein
MSETNTHQPFIEAPRPAMSETAFRNYEKWIARATKGTYIVDKEMLNGTKGSSWVVGFNEARRGYKRFHYKSEVIPLNYDLSKIKVKVGVDGRVLVENKWEEDKARDSVSTKLAIQTVNIASNGELLHWTSKEKPDVEIVAPERVDELIAGIKNGEIKAPRTAFIVQPTDPAQKDMLRLAAIGTYEMDVNNNAKMLGRIPGVSVEDVGGGWYRLS